VIHGKARYQCGCAQRSGSGHDADEDAGARAVETAADRSRLLAPEDLDGSGEAVAGDDGTDGPLESPGVRRRFGQNDHFGFVDRTGQYFGEKADLPLDLPPHDGDSSASFRHFGTRSRLARERRSGRFLLAGHAQGAVRQRIQAGGIDRFPAVLADPVRSLVHPA